MVTEHGTKRVNVAEAPHGRDRLLQVLRGEADDFFKLVAGADNTGWHTATPCERWEVRDIVGHMVDVSETYLGRYYIALEGWPATDPLGLRGYAKAMYDGSLALRGVPQYELIGRLKAAWDRLLQIWTALPDNQWAGLNISHKYAGPVPQFMMPVFQLMDYTYHSWDIRKALGQPALLGQEGAGILVPFMAMLPQFCFAPERAEGFNCTLGIEVAGPYGGAWCARLKDQQLTIEEGDIARCQAVIRYKDAQEFCLNAYGRTNSGRVSGDRELVHRFKGLFFSL